jgi:hypothetical protein
MGTPNQALAKEVRETIARLSQDNETGIIQITSSKQDQITLLIQNGKIPHGYLKDKEHQRRILNEEWQQLLEIEAECSVIFNSKPSQSLLLQKILLEYHDQAKEGPLKTSQLASLIYSSEKSQRASVQHIRWRGTEAFVISSGIELSQRKALLLTNDMVVETPDTLQQIFDWHETECTVTTYEGNIESPTWLEIYLNILFEWTCSQILEQYSYLTGRVMINSIIRNLLVKVAKEGWDISGTDGSVLNHTIFASPVEAGEAYRAMLTNIYKSIEPVIGPVLLFSIQRQINNLCKGNYSSIARMYELFS